MVSGLKVNFWKSSLMGVNVSTDFLRLASAFLNCRVGSIPFKYLGLPIGANPRRVATWEPLLASLRKRLSAWGNKYVSRGGRIVLLNSVLNAIPIFYLSFLKIPVQVWKQVRRIQREFLWGGRRGRKRISWIKWDVICLPKKKGGLGVRDIRVVNISLLAKWRWKLLVDDQAVWKEVVKSKYGNDVCGKTEIGDEHRPWFSSLWWRDICSIGQNLNHNWFANGVVRKMGNGLKTSFWRDKWAGDIPLKDRFPRLFSISNQKDAVVAAVYNPLADNSRWSLVWRRRLFEWEKELVNELLGVINQTGALIDAEDRWGWMYEGGADFTVKSTYRSVSLLCGPEVDIEPWNTVIFSSIWKCPAPSKVNAFVWQLLHGRVPTRNNLATRRIIDISGDLSCALCGEAMESEQHLFIYCEIAMLLWMEILGWLEVPFILPHNLFSLFHGVMRASSAKMRKGLVMICNAVCWNIWRCRNSILFDNGSMSVAELVEAVKVSSWKWWISCSSNSSCLFYEWQAEPRLCLLR
jgi:hypothetical protein